MRRIKLDNENLSVVLIECEDYASGENDNEQREIYVSEILQVRCACVLSQKWDIMLGSGIFHDAIGEIAERNDDYVEVNEEY